MSSMELENLEFDDTILRPIFVECASARDPCLSANSTTSIGAIVSYFQDNVPTLSDQLLAELSKSLERKSIAGDVTWRQFKEASRCWIKKLKEFHWLENEEENNNVGKDSCNIMATDTSFSTESITSGYSAGCEIPEFELRLQQIRCLEDENTAMHEELLRTEESLKTLEKQRDALRQRLDQCLERCQQLEKKNDDHTDDLRELMRKERTCSLALQKSIKKNELLIVRLDEAESKIASYGLLRDRYEKVFRENVDYGRRLTDIREKFTEKCNECEELRSMIIRLEETSSRIREENASAMHKLRQECRELTEKNMELQFMRCGNFSADRLSTSPVPSDWNYHVHSTPYKFHGNHTVQRGDSLYAELKASGFTEQCGRDDTRNRELEEELSHYNDVISIVVEKVQSVTDILEKKLGEPRSDVMEKKVEFDDSAIENNSRARNREILMEKMSALSNTANQFVPVNCVKLNSSSTQIRGQPIEGNILKDYGIGSFLEHSVQDSQGVSSEKSEKSGKFTDPFLFHAGNIALTERQIIDPIVEQLDKFLTICQQGYSKNSHDSSSPRSRLRSIHTLPSPNAKGMAEKDSAKCSTTVTNSAGDGRRELGKNVDDAVNKSNGRGKVKSLKAGETMKSSCSDEGQLSIGTESSECSISKDEGPNDNCNESESCKKAEKCGTAESPGILREAERSPSKTVRSERHEKSDERDTVDKSDKLEKVERAGETEILLRAEKSRKMGKSEQRGRSGKPDESEKSVERTKWGRSGQQEKSEDAEGSGKVAEKCGKIESKRAPKKTDESKIPRRKISICHSSFDVSLLTSASCAETAERRENREIQEIQRIQKTQKMGKIKERKKFARHPSSADGKKESKDVRVDQNVDHNISHITDDSMDHDKDNSIDQSMDHNENNVEYNIEHSVDPNIDQSADQHKPDNPDQDKGQGEGQNGEVKVKVINDQIPTISQEKKLVTIVGVQGFETFTTNESSILNIERDHNVKNSNNNLNNNNNNNNDQHYNNETQVFSINGNDLDISSISKNDDNDKDSDESHKICKTRETLFNTDHFEISNGIVKNDELYKNSEISFNTIDVQSSESTDENDRELYGSRKLSLDVVDLENSKSTDESPKTPKADRVREYGENSYNMDDLENSETIDETDEIHTSDDIYENHHVSLNMADHENSDSSERNCKLHESDGANETREILLDTLDVESSDFTAGNMLNSRMTDRQDKLIDGAGERTSDSELWIDAGRSRLFVDYRASSTIDCTDSSDSSSPRNLILPDELDVNSPNLMTGNFSQISVASTRSAKARGPFQPMKTFRLQPSRLNIVEPEKGPAICRSDKEILENDVIRGNGTKILDDHRTRDVDTKNAKDPNVSATAAESSDNHKNNVNYYCQLSDAPIESVVDSLTCSDNVTSSKNTGDRQNAILSTKLEWTAPSSESRSEHERRADTVNGTKDNKNRGGNGKGDENFEISGNFQSSTPFPDKVCRGEKRDFFVSMQTSDSRPIVSNISVNPTSSLNWIASIDLTNSNLKKNGADINETIDIETVEKTGIQKNSETYMVSSPTVDFGGNATAATSSGAISQCFKVTESFPRPSPANSGATESSVAVAMSSRDDDDSSCESDPEIDGRANGSINPLARDDPAAATIATRKKSSKLLAFGGSKNGNRERRRRVRSSRRSFSENDALEEEGNDCRCRNPSSGQQRQQRLKHDEDVEEKPKVFPNLADIRLQESGIANLSDVNSEYSDNLSEEELERTYAALSIGLGSDRATLSRRMELSTRQRDQSERNLASEVQKMQQDIQDLAPICTDRESIERVERVRHQLDMIARCAHRVSCAAETLGAMQQEFRISRGVLLADRYLQLLRSRCEKLSADVSETKRILAENNIVIEEHPGELGEELPRIRYRCAGMPSNNRMMMARRRASIAAISRPLSANLQDVSKENPRQRNSVPGRMTIRRPSLCYETQKWDGQKLDRTETSNSVGELREIFEQAESRRNSREEGSNSNGNNNNNDSVSNNNALRVQPESLQLVPLSPDCNGTGSDHDMWNCAKIERLQETGLTAELSPILLRSQKQKASTGTIADRRWMLFFFLLFFFLGFFIKQAIVSYIETYDGPPLEWWSIEELLEQYVKVRHASPRPI